MMSRPRKRRAPDETDAPPREGALSKGRSVFSMRIQDVWPARSMPAPGEDEEEDEGMVAIVEVEHEDAALLEHPSAPSDTASNRACANWDGASDDRQSKRAKATHFVSQRDCEIDDDDVIITEVRSVRAQPSPRSSTAVHETAKQSQAAANDDLHEKKPVDDANEVLAEKEPAIETSPAMQVCPIADGDECRNDQTLQPPRVDDPSTAPHQPQSVQAPEPTIAEESGSQNHAAYPTPGPVTQPLFHDHPQVHAERMPENSSSMHLHQAIAQRILRSNLTVLAQRLDAEYDLFMRSTTAGVAAYIGRILTRASSVHSAAVDLAAERDAWMRRSEELSRLLEAEKRKRVAAEVRKVEDDLHHKPEKDGENTKKKAKRTQARPLRNKRGDSFVLGEHEAAEATNRVQVPSGQYERPPSELALSRASFDDARRTVGQRRNETPHPDRSPTEENAGIKLEDENRDEAEKIKIKLEDEDLII